MCLAVPSKVISISKENNLAMVETMGVSREVALDLCPGIQVGDFVLVHVGFIIRKVNTSEALKSLALYRQIASQGEA